MQHSCLPFLEIAPRFSAQACVIWLHGLGADGHDFIGIVPELQLPEQLAIRFVFPHAPVRAVTVNAGQRMRAWYDITQPDLSRVPDRQGILDSAAAVQQLITHQHALGIPYQRIILAGFSQGGVIALHAGLRYPHPLGGIMALSTYFPLMDEASALTPENRATPILMAHGQYDPVIPLSYAAQSCQGLQRLGYAVNWQVYPMQHSVCADEIALIGRTIQQRLAL